ncbi:protein MAIN-LIKE 1-like [Lathyrus oleraceus]|uniref:protein MAIN-LIKE 1-like n=1 Tax=Pisum sativum TaxID=3888 RepID=UPI0021D2CE97|nr:protein MAIN-LIKE 1-like [Pisum sativum]
MNREEDQIGAPEPRPLHPEFSRRPFDTSLLVRYQDHVARNLWFNEIRASYEELKIVAHGSKLIGWVPHSLPPRTTLSMIDQNLVSIFMERWHLETSSFHMSFGEMTITLEDSSCLLHLACRGDFCSPTHGSTDFDGINLVINLLGVSLKETTEEVRSCIGAYYRLDWFERHCSSLFRDFPGCDRYIGDASFYTCKQLGGYASLLQCWIHEYFPTVGKRGFSKIVGIGSPLPRAMKWMYKQDTHKVDELRPMLDGLTHVDVIWRPFEDHRQHQPFDDICLYRGDLKWYDTIVLYLSDRCLRQFGYRQYILPPPPDVDTLDVDVEWITYHASMMDVIRLTVSAATSYDVAVDYLDWYYMVSHPRLVPPPRREMRQVLVHAYDERPSDLRLSFISHELCCDLYRHEAEEDDNEFC